MNKPSYFNPIGMYSNMSSSTVGRTLPRYESREQAIVVADGFRRYGFESIVSCDADGMWTILDRNMTATSACIYDGFTIKAITGQEIAEALALEAGRSA